MILVEQIKIPIGERALATKGSSHEQEELKRALCKKLACKSDSIPEFEIVKKSVDARRKPDIFYIYSLKLNMSIKELSKRADFKNIKEYTEEVYTFPYEKLSGIEEEKRPVIVGFGPGGIFIGLELAKAGFRPIILERGSQVEKRSKDVEDFWKTGRLNPNSNVQFGEGGAGTFSDGKLNTNTGGRGGRSARVIKTFASYGAPEAILYDNKPHIGTDILTDVVKNIREEIKALGGEIYFDSRFDRLIIEGNRVVGLTFTDLNSGQEKQIKTSSVCLAIGHSARDTFVNIHKDGLDMESKAFAVGIRMEHPQSLIDKNMYGENLGSLRKELSLATADYKLTAKSKEGRGVYSFCMCPGGFVVNSSSEKGRLVVNGMSYHDRDSANANSAIIVNVNQDDFGHGLFDGMNFQRELENSAYKIASGRIPIQRLGDFKIGEVTKKLGEVIPQTKGEYAFADLNRVLPGYISQAIKDVIPDFNRKIPGFDMDDALCLGVESRTSSPIRIKRDENLMSSIKGVFPCGEGAGYAGGITSAAVDGIKVAEAVASWIMEK